MIDQKIIEKLEQLDDITILRRLPYSERSFFEYGFQRGYAHAFKGFCHPASEVPRNDNGKILAFSKVNSNIKLYDMNAMLAETACDTYQEMWEVRVRAYTFTDWVFVEDILDLIKKGGNQ